MCIVNSQANHSLTSANHHPKDQEIHQYFNNFYKLDKQELQMQVGLVLQPEPELEHKEPKVK
jgi:hypothetical protein